MTTSIAAILTETMSVARVGRDLGPFLRNRVRPQEATLRVEQLLIDRERKFCEHVRRVFDGPPKTPYRSLLEWAGVSPSDIGALTAQVGVEGALERLHDAGVYLTFEEFKCLRPIVRPGLELAPRTEDFDNPLTTRHYETRTGGTGGTPRRILVDLALLEHESDYLSGLYEAAGASERPLALWHPAPPGAVGIKNALIHARLGRPPQRWFSQTRSADTSVKHDLFTRAVVLSARARRTRIPAPQHTPAAGVGVIVSWLADSCERGEPPVFVTTPSACVRACLKAKAEGSDITGTLFVLIGEPYTLAKAAVVAEAGARALTHYGMVETGLIGLACGAAEAPDDVHLLGGKIATIQREGRDAGASPLFHTTLSPATPKVMLNVESGDQGVIETRKCACGALPDGYSTHLHSIRSYEKLTTEGMSFLPDDLYELVERFLPERFGGNTGDYQLAERDQDWLSTVSLVASVAVGPLREGDVVTEALAFLGSRGPAQRMMAEVWSQSGTLRLERGEPTSTLAGKLFPLRAASAVGA